MGKKLGFSFSWKRASGLSGIKTSIAKKSGIPTTRGGLERKLGNFIMKLITGKL
jgi:hypothetical protein